MNTVITLSLLVALLGPLVALTEAENSNGAKVRSSTPLGAFGQRSSSESLIAKARPTTATNYLSPNAIVSPATTSSAASTSSQAGSRINPPAASSEVETLSSAPSSWQLLTAVEAPTATLIASGTRRSARSSDLSSASSEDSSSFFSQSDVLRSPGGTKGGSQSRVSQLRQQASGKTRQQQQQGKTSNYQASKTNWYKPSTTPRPAPIVQQYEQQSEQYTEQQQVDSAPAGQAEPFAFDFNTQDDSGNGQYRKEESDNNGVVRGSYGFRDASGIYRHVEYVADQNGFRANIKSNEPGVEGGPDSQPASIKLDGGSSPAQSQPSSNNNNRDSGEWTASSSSSNERAELALAPPDFESSHRAERIRSPNNFRS